MKRGIAGGKTKVLVHPTAMSHRRPASPAILKVTGLEMHYPMGKISVPALRSIDLKVHRGEFLSIMGSSGSGKSTLLHLIGGLLGPTKGHIYVAGRDLTAMTDAERTELRRKEIGFVFQRFNLFPTLSVDDNIRLAERIYSGAGPRYNGDPARRVEILSLLGLENKRHHKPSELSGGEQQRVALARAVINRPSILLADEPTGNLDSTSSEAVLEMLRKLNREMGQTIVMITHNREAADYSERTIRMKDGRITVDTSLVHFWGNEFPQERLSLG
jgi:putative ABC transport system ATP-binding protein